ncbi:leucine-rich repeat domain-containing protein [Ruminococcus champanellensis]|uniref:leucine-rich repeat domain-containing protein n=1 Tax=Ruminococcus champanellensis TaxID=1161942 RepID=UPI0023F1B7B2|nr:leucine-rich repeat domain-containing protein [Ruminococcus champanellensis]
MNKHVKRMQSAAICAALLWSAGAYPLAEGVKPLLTSITAYAEDGTLANGLHYRINDGAAIIDGYTGSEKSLEIPSEIDGYPVTQIGWSAFSGCTSLTSITIPYGVVSIGWKAFFGCTSLTSITIPEDVTSIGESAFESCTSLTSITIPESVTYLGWKAFSGCASLTSVTIPGSVTSIGIRTFSGCTSLTSITIPGSVTSIGSSAFSDCTSLTSITIPDSVTRIDSYAFSGCTGLELITILNPACEIYDDNTTLSDSAVIMGYQNSTAQKYAEENNRAFELITQGDEAAGAQIWGCTMTLGEQLTLNYQVHLTAETASDANAYMLFILPDGSIQRVPVADAKINADDLYVFPCSFPARMMNQQIYARLVTSDANSDFHGYSGAKYLETVAADSSNEAAQELAQKTLDYGTYAEAYFDKNAAAVPEDNEMRNTTISAKPVRIDGDLPEGIAYYGMSLLLRDQVAVRLYFDVDDSVHASAYGLTHKEGTYYYLDTPVSAENLLNEQTVNIGSASITFSSMSYASLACSSSSDEKLQATMKSLYLYAKAAQEYQEYLDPFPQGSAWRVKAGCSFVVELYPSSEGYMNATEGYVITILGTYNGSSCEVAVSERFGAAVKYGRIINLSVEDKEFLTRLEE